MSTRKHRVANSFTWYAVSAAVHFAAIYLLWEVGPSDVNAISRRTSTLQAQASLQDNVILLPETHDTKVLSAPIKRPVSLEGTRIDKARHRKPQTNAAPPAFHPVTDLTTLPQLIANEPNLLALPAEGLFHGRMLISLLIDSQGKVASVQVLETSIPIEQQRMIVVQFRNAVFRPGAIHGIPVASALTIEVGIGQPAFISNPAETGTYSDAAN